MQTLDILIWAVGIGLVASFIYLLYSYSKGLRSSPRELIIMFLAKIVEYSAYGAMNLSFVLYLSADCGLSDIAAGSYIGVWSMTLTLTMILVGAVCDAIGIKKTLIGGTIFLLFARIFMPFTNNVVVTSIFGFLPLAVGTAILGPVLSVGIKRYTTKEGSALGFALFYTLMNVGWAIGGHIFDGVRGIFGEHSLVTLPVVGAQISTYQIIFLVAFFLTIPNLIILALMRDRVRMTEDQGVVIDPPDEKIAGGFFVAAWGTLKKAAKDTARIFGQVIIEKPFWIYLFMLAILVPVRLVFYHFHYTFPKYGIRILGEGVKIGNIYSVLNPTLIVFLVPLFGALTRKISSYRMMLVGTLVSASSVFIATLPSEIFAPLVHTWFGELVYDRWLGVPVEQRTPIFLSLVIFIAIFTIGEAIWSPRLMQFTAEIAPKGREGSYISLSYLPFFLAKLVAGPMSGLLLTAYVPVGAESYPHHHLVWVWIGGMAALSPLGLLLFRKLFNRAEEKEVTAVA
ncbi:MAG: MFS transporter [Myxococcales bacterium]|nr:MFS transporter [Myxococcales bacterium]